MFQRPRVRFWFISILLPLVYFPGTTARSAAAAPEPSRVPADALAPGDPAAPLGGIPSHPPVGPVRQCAEWEPVTGALITYRWFLPTELIRELAEDLELWIFIRAVDTEAACIEALLAAGVDTSNVNLIDFDTSSYTRDYGPQFIFDGEEQAGIVDFEYYPSRPIDDASNGVVGAAWDTPVYQPQILHLGGNHMCDGHGNGFATTEIFVHNPGLTPAEAAASMQQFLGLDSFRTYQDPAPDGICHIDVWAKLVSETRVMIKQVPPDYPSYATYEARAADFAALETCYGTPMEVVRVLCPPYLTDRLRDYTNCIILNDKVLVPLYNIPQDAAALASWEQAMPGYEVLGFPHGWSEEDAIHCRVMGIHDKGMLYVDVPPLPSEAPAGVLVEVPTLILDYSQAGLVEESCRLYWRTSPEDEWSSQQLVALAQPHQFRGVIPAQAPGVTVDYYVGAEDETGRTWQRPPVAPNAWYSYDVVPATAGVLDGSKLRLVLEPATPNPFSGSTHLRFALAERGNARLWVTDAQGRTIANLAAADFAPGVHSIHWDGSTTDGKRAAAGVYFVRMEAFGVSRTERVVRVR